MPPEPGAVRLRCALCVSYHLCCAVLAAVDDGSAGGDGGDVRGRVGKVLVQCNGKLVVVLMVPLVKMPIVPPRCSRWPWGLPSSRV